jgi:NAD(P)-dependent dehydrogenase (short-subunit alcohol dehydrogenase family)
MSAWLGLEGRRVVLAGAGGIGAAIARGFADAGARVAVLDARAEALETLSADLGLEERGGATIVADISSADACRTAAREALEALGGIDVFVHAVGVNNRQPLESFTDDQWDQMLGVNLSSVFWLAREFAPILRDQGSGRLVFLSSVAGLLGHKHHGPYAATKGAINQLTRVLANELASSGVTVNAVAPGYVETDLTATYLATGSNREALTRLVPAGRLGTPQEVVGSLLFLASPQAGFITGHVLYVDGGRTLV